MSREFTGGDISSMFFSRFHIYTTRYNDFESVGSIDMRCATGSAGFNTTVKPHINIEFAESSITFGSHTDSEYFKNNHSPYGQVVDIDYMDLIINTTELSCRSFSGFSNKDSYHVYLVDEEFGKLDDNGLLLSLSAKGSKDNTSQGSVHFSNFRINSNDIKPIVSNDGEKFGLLNTKNNMTAWCEPISLMEGCTIKVE